MSRHLNGYVASFYLAIVLVVALVAGCADRLLVKTEPSGARLTVTDSTGRLVKEGAAPIRLDVSFASDRKYLVKAAPSPDQAEQFDASEREVDAATYAELPRHADKTRILEVALPKKEYVNLAYVEVVLVPGADGKKWVGLLTQARAFERINEPGGAVPTRVVEFDENLGIAGMSLSPDGSRIVYSVGTYDRPASQLLQNLEDLNRERAFPLQASNLRGVTTSGGGIQQITAENFRDMYPGFSPDGRHLLFSSNRRRTDRGDILRISATGPSGISNIYVDQRNGEAAKPTQAEDGTVAFALYPEGSPGSQTALRSEVWTIGGPNQFPTQVVVRASPQPDPAVSPDGKRLAYIGLDGNLWVCNTDGGQRTQLTFGADRILQRWYGALSEVERRYYDMALPDRVARNDNGVPLVAQVPWPRPFRFPSWSADGRYILYTSMEGNDPTGRPNEDIWIMRYDGTAKQQLTTNGSLDRFPLMSPDSVWVYFMSNRGARWAIWRIPAPTISP